MEGDAVYFSRRAKEERSAASNASHATARQAHLDMANRYEELAAGIGARGPKPPKIPSVQSSEPAKSGFAIAFVR